MLRRKSAWLGYGREKKVLGWKTRIMATMTMKMITRMIR